MDEILATIRRIIADEEQPGAPAGASGAAATGPVGAPAGGGETAEAGGNAAAHDAAPAHEDVFELTQALNDDGSVRHLAPIGGAAPRPPAEPPASPGPPERIEPPAPALDRPPAATPEPAAAAASAAPPAAPAPATGPDEGPGERPDQRPDQRIVSDVASFAAAAAFAHLAQVPRRAAGEMPRIGDRTLEDLVGELLRPLLRAWLDDNLPQLVERLVQAEITRVVDRSGVD